MEQLINHTDDLEIPSFWRHNKNGRIYLLAAIDHFRQSVSLHCVRDGGRADLAAGALRNLYREVQRPIVKAYVEANRRTVTGEPLLPIGSVTIEAVDAIADRYVKPERPEPVLLRPKKAKPPKKVCGRPRSPVGPANSYFANPRKSGPKQPERQKA